MAQILCIFAVFLLVVTGVSGKFVSLGDSVNLTASQDCGDGERFTLIHRLKDDSPITVANRVNGVWEPEVKYANRIKHHSRVCVALSRVNYNDDGFYEFTCGSVVTVTQLDVVVSSQVSVFEGGTAKLPCYVKAGVKSIRWEKADGELVIELELSSSEIRYGPGFEGNVSVSSDWHSAGDMSLTLTGAQIKDRGDYFCYIQDKDGKRRRGDPAAARLTVNKRNSDHISAPRPACPTQEATEEKGKKTWSVVIITIIVTLVIVAPSSFGFSWWLKSRTSNVTSGSAGGDEEMALRKPPGPQVDGRAANDCRG